MNYKKCSDCGTDKRVMEIRINEGTIWFTCHNCFLIRLHGVPVTYEGEVIGHITTVANVSVEMKLGGRK